jgi:hypothetical protein
MAMEMIVSQDSGLRTKKTRVQMTRGRIGEGEEPLTAVAVELETMIPCSSTATEPGTIIEETAGEASEVGSES